MNRTLVIGLLTGTVLLAIQGCSGGGSFSSGGSWGNYKCTASSSQSGSGHRSIGWATNRGDAKSNALDKCRAHSTTPGNCHIVRCVSESSHHS